MPNSERTGSGGPSTPLADPSGGRLCDESTRSHEINSNLNKFYRLSPDERRQRVADMTGLAEDDLRVVTGDEGLAPDQANRMVENVVGVFGLPLSVCVNLTIDGRDRLAPMVIEESSVVAAASHAAKLLRAGGGITTTLSPPHMIGQIQVMNVAEPSAADGALRQAAEELVASANTCDPCLVRHGGGALALDVRHLPPIDDDDPVGSMVVVHLIVDVREAMGANTVNTMCEHLAPRIEQLTGGNVRLRIVSNLADRRTVVAEGCVPLKALEGKGGQSPLELARGIEEASVFAERDPYRAATHNKGIMNGVDAVLLAFGQDWRAVEAGAHAFAARDGRYGSLSRWRVRDDLLVGRLELPMPVGLVGGVTRVHPTCQVVRRISQVTRVADLTSLTAAVGLAQNLGALRALAAEGIQHGHMRAHARNVAVAAGAVESEVDAIAASMTDSGSVSVDSAQEALAGLRSNRGQTGDRPQVRQRFSRLRETHLPAILALIDETLAEATPPQSTLTRMCSYHMESGGKRLRALLPLLVADTLGSDPTSLVPFGAACEMLHNATLVHDDLQDGDELRRGVRTVWRHFGSAQAINLGDAMYYYTLELLHRLQLPLGRREAAARRVLRETLRVIDGQEREFLLREHQRPSLAAYFHMVEGKTSGLFALPMAGAAALCGASQPVVAAMQEAARHLGVVFQIQDDILDLYAEKGRNAYGNDIREGKRSVLIVHALECAPPAQATRMLEILDADRDQTSDADVDELIRMLSQSGALRFALEQVTARSQQAQRAMEVAGNNRLTAMVAALCDLFLEPIRPVMTEHGPQGNNPDKHPQ